MTEICAQVTSTIVHPAYAGSAISWSWNRSGSVSDHQRVSRIHQH